MASAAPNVDVLSSRAVRHLLTALRNKNTPCAKFAWYADRLFNILVEEAITYLPTRDVEVDTPVPGATFRGTELDEDKLCVVSIVRAGDSLLRAVRHVLPGIPIGKILIQRDESSPTKEPKLFYSKLPPDVSERFVILTDPMLATGGSAACAIEVLKDAGVTEDRILFVNVVACPEGARRLAESAPAVKILTAAMDEGLNEHKYIVPGLGDFGDRYFGTA